MEFQHVFWIIYTVQISAPECQAHNYPPATVGAQEVLLAVGTNSLMERFQIQNIWYLMRNIKSSQVGEF